MSERDIAFGTDGWRASGEAFTMDRVRAIGAAVVRELDARSESGAIYVGYDARRRSREAAMTLAAIVASLDREPVVASRDCPTPALAWSVRTANESPSRATETADDPTPGAPRSGTDHPGRSSRQPTTRDGAAAGLMVTASHNPPDYNGVKIVNAAGAPAMPAFTDAVQARIEPVDTPAVDRESITTRPLHEPYIQAVLTAVDADLDGLTVAYDAMHGSGRGVTDAVLASAGASIRSIRTNRDPSFGGVAPEPGPETIGDLESLVDSEADIGIINDGDADRVGVVTPDRGYVDANVLLAVIYEYLLESRRGDVVRTVPTSSLVDRIAESAGHTVHETPVGFKWVAQAMVEHDALAGGEESGGYGLGGHLPNKDGVLVALLACAAAVDQSLDERIDALIDTHGGVHQTQESVDCPEAEKAARVEALATSPPAEIAGTQVLATSTVDGVKFTLPDGEWVLVRPSGTEPKIRVYAEAGTTDRVRELVAAGRGILTVRSG